MAPVGITNPGLVDLSFVRKIADVEPGREAVSWHASLVSASSPCPAGVLALMSLKAGLESIIGNKFFPF